MAKIFPAGWNHIAVTGAAVREIETLEILRAELPDHYSVYRGVHWTRLRSGFSIFGEADFIVVSPSGRLMESSRIRLSGRTAQRPGQSLFESAQVSWCSDRTHGFQPP